MRSLWIVLLMMLLPVGKVLGETYVVCVGIANYADPKVRNLVKSEQDAKSMAEFYKKGTPNVITVTGRYATKSQIIQCLKSQFGRAKRGDRILFYFSGHGYPGGFCPYDMRRPEDGLTYEEVLRIMKASNATDKFIFADACNSGAIRNGGSGGNPETGNVMMFLSSRGNEMSVEKAFQANGCFTRHLLRGLGGAADSDADRKITAAELYRYVSMMVRKDSGDRQHPVMWGKFPEDLVIVRYATR